jgi:hypothetical protein
VVLVARGRPSLRRVCVNPSRLACTSGRRVRFWFLTSVSPRMACALLPTTSTELWLQPKRRSHHRAPGSRDLSSPPDCKPTRRGPCPATGGRQARTHATQPASAGGTMGKRDACPTNRGYTPLMATGLFAHPPRIKSESRDGSGHNMSAQNRHLVIGQPSRLSPGQRAGQARRLSYGSHRKGLVPNNLGQFRRLGLEIEPPGMVYLCSDLFRLVLWQSKPILARTPGCWGAKERRKELEVRSGKGKDEG